MARPPAERGRQVLPLPHIAAVLFLLLAYNYRPSTSTQQRSLREWIEDHGGHVHRNFTIATTAEKGAAVFATGTIEKSADIPIVYIPTIIMLHEHTARMALPHLLNDNENGTAIDRYAEAFFTPLHQERIATSKLDQPHAVFTNFRTVTASAAGGQRGTVVVGDPVELRWEEAAGGDGKFHVATVHAVHRDGRIDAVFTDGPDEGDDMRGDEIGVAALAAYLQLEMDNPASHWAPYFAALPRACQMTICWPETRWRATFVPSHVVLLRRRRARYARVATTLGFPVDAYLQKVSLVLSRMWRDNQGVRVLVPFLDLVNHGQHGHHAPPEVTFYEYGQGSGLHATYPYERGQELLFSYGEYNNAQLLMDYGFVTGDVPNRHDDCVSMRLFNRVTRSRMRAQGVGTALSC